MRQLTGDPKYKLVKGSCRECLFPFAEVVPGRPVIICEGEFDCLLLNQILDGEAQAFTLGSASSHPSFAVLIKLAAASQIVIGSDNDDAGESTWEYWSQLSPNVRRLKVPKGKDWTEAHLAGVDLKEWFDREFTAA